MLLMKEPNELIRYAKQGIYEDGKAIAVKLPSHDWIKLTDKEFEAEALKHINIQHQNIVKCVGYSTTKSQNQTSEIDKGRFVITETSARALCFEYHKNIRLDRLIQERFYIVDWETRYRIIKGICEGLRYLQEGWAADIYMVDLEPSRIFVDESMVARIDVQRPGYHNDHLPPEYKSQGLTLKRTDTYSFGVIIMQTMAFYEDYLNRVEETSEEFIELVLCKCKSMQQGTVGHTLSKLYLQQMRRCIQIALACVDHHSSSRPSITEIIDMLNETETRILKQLQTLDVAPLQLCFMFEPPRKYVSCSLQLTNYGGHRIAFRLVSHSSPTKKFFTKLPLYGVVPPKCTYTLTLTMRKWPQQAPLKDEAFTLQSVPVQDQDLQDLDILDQESIITEYNKYFDNDQQVTHEEVRQLTLKAVSNPQTEEATNFTVATCVWKHVIMYLRCLQRVAVKSRPKSLYCLNKQAEHIPRVIWQPREHAIEIIASLKAQQALSIEVHPTGPWIMTTHHDGSLHVWNYKTMVPLEAFNFTDEPGTVTQVTLNPLDAGSFASASYDGTVKIWSLHSDVDNFVTFTPDEHPEDLVSVDYFPCGSRQNLITRSKHGTALIWDTTKNRGVQKLDGHAHHLNSIYCHPELPKVITGSQDGTVRIWDSFTYRLETIIDLNLGKVCAFGYISGLRRIIVGCHQGMATVDINLPRRPTRKIISDDKNVSFL
ncbi:hypothetical protein QOZ80_4AG0326750 [Eleusine coracana subsp. coracana]|nr:hypothetical protein QOZ80_4AG0326750 [Eleusine coracana subsp. coracana]